MYVSLFPCQRRVGYGLTLLQGLRVACYVQLVAICAVYLSWSSTSAEASRGSGAHIRFGRSHLHPTHICDHGPTRPAAVIGVGILTCTRRHKHCATTLPGTYTLADDGLTQTLVRRHDDSADRCTQCTWVHAVLHHICPYKQHVSFCPPW